MAAACAALIPLGAVAAAGAAVGRRPRALRGEAGRRRRRRRGATLLTAFGALARASRTRTFWLLFATFYVCGFTTNGLVGTHLIALCGDQGIPEVQASSLLAAMGLFDLVGTTLSGWLADRYDPRKLLFMYYGLRGLSLVYLPFSDFSSTACRSSRCSTGWTGSPRCRRRCG